VDWSSGPLARHSLLRRRWNPIGGRRRSGARRRRRENIRELARPRQPSADRRPGTAFRRTMRCRRRRQPDLRQRLSCLSIHRRSWSQPRHCPAHARLGARSAGTWRRGNRTQLHGERWRAPGLRHHPADARARNLPCTASRLRWRREPATFYASVLRGSGEIAIASLKKQLLAAGVEVRP
jgi:hypothetical protein